MPSLARSVAVGLAGGLVASLAMHLFQSVGVAVLRQDGGDDEPATVKAADSANQIVAVASVADDHRQALGSLVHHATGAALGIGYAPAARRWPKITAGWGLAYGVAVATDLDDVAVPAFDGGPSSTDTSAATHAFGIASHAMSGLVLEGTRRGAEAVRP